MNSVSERAESITGELNDSLFTLLNAHDRQLCNARKRFACHQEMSVDLYREAQRKIAGALISKTLGQRFR
jgi:hypothetical protein